MKKEDIALLREIKRNTERGLQALELVENKIYDDNFSLVLMRESFRFRDICDRAKAGLASAKQMPEPPNKVEEMMMSASVWANTALNTSTGHLAEMMIKGNAAGLSGIWKAMNHNSEAGEQAVKLAEELLDLEENNIKELKKYL